MKWWKVLHNSVVTSILPLLTAWCIRRVGPASPADSWKVWLVNEAAKSAAGCLQGSPASLKQLERELKELPRWCWGTGKALARLGMGSAAVLYMATRAYGASTWIVASAFVYMMGQVYPRYGPVLDRVELAGSRGSGTHLPGSDVDILILFKATGRQLTPDGIQIHEGTHVAGILGVLVATTPDAERIKRLDRPEGLKFGNNELDIIPGVCVKRMEQVRFDAPATRAFVGIFGLNAVRRDLTLCQPDCVRSCVILLKSILAPSTAAERGLDVDIWTWLLVFGKGFGMGDDKIKTTPTGYFCSLLLIAVRMECCRDCGSAADLLRALLEKLGSWSWVDWERLTPSGFAVPDPHGPYQPRIEPRISHSVEAAELTVCDPFFTRAGKPIPVARVRTAELRSLVEEALMAAV
eukprot:TRINITY_DN44429_c0_g1_i2.p1 TRINITY_DN44429_c0_g1~~TRINITY_DN44429_c0_g1_i2.p1  ORF type:complete len:435 (+),score=40.08 TRINITY_DN44429_c0_g1_i2:83-1306(+)